MAVAARKHEEYYAPVTRVYSYSRSATAVNYEAVTAPKPVMPRPKPVPAPAPKVQAQPVPKADPHLGRKVLSIASVVVVAIALLMVIMRYSMIASQYAEVNQLKEDIEASNLNIASLDVKLQCAINLDDARDAAQAAGMGYPTAEQIVKVGGTAADFGA